MAKSIPITKHQGEIKFKQFVLEKLEATFNVISNGEHELIIKRKLKKRTLDQNALMWLWFTCIEKETGTDKNDVHDYYCGLYLTRRVVINGAEKQVIGGTSKLNAVQFADFMNKVQADAASEFGIKLPTRADQHFEAFKEEFEKYLTSSF